MSQVRLVIDMPDQYAERLAGETDRDYIVRIVDDMALWNDATVTVDDEQEAQEKEAQWLLEKLADRNMTEGGEYGGPLPAVYAPVVFAGYGKEVVVEFRGVLHDGTRVTTTRPLAFKDADGNIAPTGVPYRSPRSEP